MTEAEAYYYELRDARQEIARLENKVVRLNLQQVFIAEKLEEVLFKSHHLQAQASIKQAEEYARRILL